MTDKENEIILAESGPKRADRPNTYHVGNYGCGMEVYMVQIREICELSPVWSMDQET